MPDGESDCQHAGNRLLRLGRRGRLAPAPPWYLAVAGVLRHCIERVDLAVPVPRVVAGPALTREERAAVDADAENVGVARRQERRAGLRIGGLVEERLDLIGPHLPVLRC